MAHQAVANCSGAVEYHDEKYPQPCLCILLIFFTSSLKASKATVLCKFTGLNFHDYVPVLQKKTQSWEPNTERLYAGDGMLIGNNFMALKLEGGGHYTCEFKSTYNYDSAIVMFELIKKGP